MSLQFTDEAGLKTSQEGRTKILSKENPTKSGNIFFRMLIGLLCLTLIIAGGGTIILLAQGEADSRIFIWFGATTIAALIALSYLLKMKR